MIRPLIILVSLAVALAMVRPSAAQPTATSETDGQRLSALGNQFVQEGLFQQFSYRLESSKVPLSGCAWEKDASCPDHHGSYEWGTFWGTLNSASHDLRAGDVAKAFCDRAIAQGLENQWTIAVGPPTDPSLAYMGNSKISCGNISTAQTAAKSVADEEFVDRAVGTVIFVSSFPTQYRSTLPRGYLVVASERGGFRGVGMGSDSIGFETIHDISVPAGSTHIKAQVRALGTGTCGNVPARAIWIAVSGNFMWQLKPSNPSPTHGGKGAECHAQYKL